jgi:hypothetical protein
MDIPFFADGELMSYAIGFAMIVAIAVFNEGLKIRKRVKEMERKLREEQ